MPHKPKRPRKKSPSLSGPRGAQRSGDFEFTRSSETYCKTILWQIHDGKPGHVNQLRGLTNALAEILPLEVHRIPAPSRRQSLIAMGAKKFTLGEKLPTPHFILGAGHATHFAVLAARRARGGRAIVLMKPSLPSALFDLCLIPEHDHVAESSKIITTRGVLNVIRPSRGQDARQGLLLLGGPSQAHDWSNERIIEQIAAITSGDPQTHWQLTTSRRTPSGFFSRVAECGFKNLVITPHEKTSPDWVPQQLAQAGQVWVSADSVSMVYESLTSGAAVGVLEVPKKRHGRVAAGVDKLLAEGWATPFAAWQPGSPLSPPAKQLDESRRCAKIVCQRFLSQAVA